jgi:hypothetical protein
MVISSSVLSSTTGRQGFYNPSIRVNFPEAAQGLLVMASKRKFVATVLIFRSRSRRPQSIHWLAKKMGEEGIDFKQRANASAQCSAPEASGSSPAHSMLGSY